MNSAPDFGVAARRTLLAWSRTALAMAADALLFLRAGVQRDDHSLLLVGVALSALALLLAGAGWQRHRALRKRQSRPVAEAVVAWTAAGVAVAAAGVLWAVRP